MHQYKTYFASGWFTKNQLETYGVVKKILDRHLEFTVFYPKEKSVEQQKSLHDELTRQEVFQQNLDGIIHCDLIVCSTEDKDTGSVFEAGYAHCLSKKILFVNFHLKGHFNLMLQQASIAIAKNKKDFELALIIIKKYGINSVLLQELKDQKKVV